MNGEALQLRIISAEGVVLDTAAESVRLPAADGSLGIRKGHTGAVFQLVKGNIHYLKDGKDCTFHLEGGAFGSVRNNIVTLLLEA